MNLNKFRQQIRWGITIFVVIAASLIFYFVLFHMDILRAGISKILTVFLPLIYGAVIAYLFNPIVKFFEKYTLKLIEKLRFAITDRKKKVLRLICVLFTVFLLLLGVYALLAMLIPELLGSIRSIIENFPVYMTNIKEWLSRILKNNPDLESSANEFIDKYLNKAWEWVSSGFLPRINDLIKGFSIGLMGFVNFLMNIVLGIIISIYILYSRESLIANAKKALYALFKTETATQFIKDVQYVNHTFGGYITGMILDSMNIGIMCYIGALILNLPYALLISVIVAVTNVIPFFGPYLGGVPSALLILLVDPLKALYFVLFIFLLQQLDGNVIAPRILGGSTGLTGFMVVVSITIGGGLFGIPGMLIGVPVCAVFCTIIKNYMEGRLKEKNLPTDREFYKDIDHLNPKNKQRVLYTDKDIKPEEVFRYKSRRDREKKDGTKSID